MPNLPSVTSPLPRDLQIFVQRVREAIDGGGLDGLVTARQMVASGVASFSNGSISSTAASRIDAPSPPTNLTGSGALANIVLSWDSPTYVGHSFTEVWAATQTTSQASAGEAPLAPQAVLVGITAGDNFSHSLGSAATRYYWVKNVNQNGLASAFNATAGVAVTTGSDPAYVLSVLSGEITTSQLHNDLDTRIDLIDGAASLTGSVNARVLAEANSRSSGDTALQSNITAEQTARTSADTALASDITTLQSTVSTNAAAITAEQTARTSADTALASDVTTLQSTVSTNAAAITAEQTARTSADTAIASDVTTLQSTVGGHTSSIQTNTSSINGVEAKHTVKIDNGGHISGYGLISTNNDATPTSEFGVRADNFWVAPPTTVQATAPTSGLYKGYAWKDSDDNVTRYWDGSAFQTTPQTIPFAVRSAGQTVNGVTVPAGVYIDTAMIADATITNAKIGSLTADKITASLLNTVDFYGNTIAGATMYLGGSVSYSQTNGVNTGISSVSNPNVTMAASGATFKVNAFKVDNGNSGTATPFQVVNNSVFIDSAVIKDAAITTAKIDDAAITTAKIQDANITTLKVADEQITATRSIAYTVPSSANRNVDQTFNLSFPHTADYVIIIGISRDIAGTFTALTDAAVQDLKLYIDGVQSARLYASPLSVVFNSNIRSHLQTINHTYNTNGTLGTIPVRLTYTLSVGSGITGGATGLRVSFHGAVK